jgi:MFS transporter, ACS family, hexuronate transporter
MTRPLSKTDAWQLALLTTLAMSLSYVDRQTLSVLAPTITKALGISDVGYGWLGSAFSLAYLAGGPLAGMWIDRVGARRGLLAAVVTWSVVAALQATAPAFGALLAMRVALGLAESPTFPGGVQAIQRGVPEGDRARGMSLLFVGMAIGGMLAPPIANGIAGRFGWRAAFVGTGALAAAWTPLWIALTSRPHVRAVLDAAPESRTDRPSMLQTASHPAMVRGLVGLLAIVPASAFAMAWEAKYYVRQFALTQQGLTGYLVASAVAYDLGAILSGDLAARRARRRRDEYGLERESPHARAQREYGLERESLSPPRALLAAGALLAALGLAGLAVAPGPHVALACFVASGAGRGAFVTLCNTDTLARVPQRAVSAAGGVIASVQSLGAIVVNPLLGHAVQGFGYSPALAVIAAWTVPGTIAWLLMPARSDAPAFEV